MRGIRSVHRARIWAGTELRTALIAAALALAALLLAGVLIYQTVRTAMFAQLEAQLAEEAVLFSAIHDNGGLPALVEALDALRATPVTGTNFAALFDAGGVRRAGNLSVAPEALLMASTTAVVATPQGEELMEISRPIRSDTLVIARSTAPVRDTLDALARSLLVAAAVIATALVGLGWWLSRASLAKLDRIEKVLDAVGRGDTGARVGLSGRGQIDRIGQRIDGALERLSALMAASENTTRAIAHELRTPLNRAYLVLQRAMDTRDGRQRRKLLEQLDAELVGLGRIFDTLLEIGRIDAGTEPARLEPVDLAVLVRETAELFADEVAARRQTVEIETGEGPVCVRGDAQMLRRLLVNLLDNAHRYTPDGGRIVLRLERRGHEAVLEVADNGPGIAEAERGEVLRPFVRGEAGRGQAGSGLGLALVAAIAARHGARLELDDAGPGLVVRLTLPAAEPGQNLTNS